MEQALKRIAKKLDTQIKKNLFLLISLFLMFEFFLLISGARSMFPEDIKGYSCYDVLNSRPWYGRINTIFLFWLFFTPAIVFSFKPNIETWKRVGYAVFTILLSYTLIILATHMGMVIRNAPFHGEGIGYFNGVLVTSEEDVFKHNCFDIADGAKYLFAIFFGWILALIYYGWWVGIWYKYHKRKTKLIDKNFKMDWLNKIIVFASIAIPLLIAIKFLMI